MGDNYQKIDVPNSSNYSGNINLSDKLRLMEMAKDLTVAANNADAAISAAFMGQHEKRADSFYRFYTNDFFNSVYKNLCAIYCSK